MCCNKVKIESPALAVMVVYATKNEWLLALPLSIQRAHPFYWSRLLQEVTVVFLFLFRKNFLRCFSIIIVKTFQWLRKIYSYCMLPTFLQHTLDIFLLPLSFFCTVLLTWLLRYYAHTYTRKYSWTFFVLFDLILDDIGNDEDHSPFLRSIHQKSTAGKASKKFRMLMEVVVML